MSRYRSKNFNYRKYPSKYRNKRLSRKFKRLGYAVAKRRKGERTIFGNIYKINDDLVSYDSYSKSDRRIVVVNNNPRRIRFVKIKGLYDDSGKRRKRVLPISRYHCLDKPSGIDKRVYKKTSRGQPIRESYLRKTNYRLNRSDLPKIFRLK